jgi:acyl-CoA thioesterase I
VTLNLLGLLLGLPVQRGVAAEACRIAVLGDSLAAGYGVPLGQAFPEQLAAALEERGYGCEVLNAGVSGDTSAGGRARLAWVLADDPSHLVVELGGNDALRALPTEQLKSNLTGIIQEAKAAGTHVFLAGMLAPPNLGREYTKEFRVLYEEIAREQNVSLYPFFLDGVVTRHDYMQPDGIHPNAEGVGVLVERILSSITDWLTSTGVSHH